MKIRYGINKPNPGKRPKILHENHGAEINAKFKGDYPELELRHQPKIRCKRQTGFLTWRILALVPLIIWIIFFCLENPVIAAPYASPKKTHFSANRFSPIPITNLSVEIQNFIFGHSRIDVVSDFVGLNKNGLFFSGLQRRVMSRFWTFNHTTDVVMLSLIQGYGVPFKRAHFGALNNFNIQISGNVLGVRIPNVSQNKFYSARCSVASKLHTPDYQAWNVGFKIFGKRKLRLAFGGFGGVFGNFTRFSGFFPQSMGGQPQASSEDSHDGGRNCRYKFRVASNPTINLNERTIEELYVYGIPGLIFVMVCVVGIGYLLQDFDDINRRNKRHNHPEDKNDSK